MIPTFILCLIKQLKKSLLKITSLLVVDETKRIEPKLTVLVEI